MANTSVERLPFFSNAAHPLMALPSRAPAQTLKVQTLRVQTFRLSGLKGRGSPRFSSAPMFPPLRPCVPRRVCLSLARPLHALKDQEGVRPTVADCTCATEHSAAAPFAKYCPHSIEDVGDTTFPAGEYDARNFTDGSDRGHHRPDHRLEHAHRWHRYAVQGYGSVELDERHANDAGCQKPSRAKLRRALG